MTKPKYPLEAAVDLVSPLKLGPEFLGFHGNAIIGGVTVEVHLPDFEKDGEEFKPVLPKQMKANWLEAFKGSVDNWDPWGSVLGWDKDKGKEVINAFSAQKLAITSVGTVSEDQAQKVLHAAAQWAHDLNAWIEVFTQTDLDKPTATVEQHGSGTRVWLDTGNSGGKGISCKHPIVMAIELQDNLKISRPVWKALLEKASSGTHPPESHMFLRDARKMINEKRYRRSVLDAATATEMALTELQANSFPAMSSDRRRDLKKKFRQIDGLVDSLALMGVAYPSNVIGAVADPRNDAIHKGREPDKTTAMQCLAKAEEVVELVFPISNLL